MTLLMPPQAFHWSLSFGHCPLHYWLTDYRLNCWNCETQSPICRRWRGRICVDRALPKVLEPTDHCSRAPAISEILNLAFNSVIRIFGGFKLTRFRHFLQILCSQMLHLQPQWNKLKRVLRHEKQTRPLETSW